MIGAAPCAWHASAAYCSSGPNGGFSPDLRRRTKVGPQLDNGVLSGRQPAGRAGRFFVLWSGVTAWPISSDRRLKVGFIPIIDCAPIVLAEELGAFERQGLEVEIRREVSWANVRDKLALGVLDAVAHPGAAAACAHARHRQRERAAGQRHDARGERQRAHPVAEPVAGDGRGGARARRPGARRSIARALAAVVARRAAAGAPQLVLASVFPYSVQNYMLRLWLSSGGLDPDRDVRLTVVPPPHTVAHLSGGVIDGYCVGEPWNQRSEALGIGRIALTGPDIWKGMPEKVLGTTEAWARTQSRHLEGADQGADRSLPVARRAGQSRRGRARSVEPALPQHAGRGDFAHARPAGLPRLPARRTPTSRGAAMPTGSWRRWCAGARRRPTSTSRPPPIASIAPISTAPPRARWASPVPTSTACRPAAMASRCAVRADSTPQNNPVRLHVQEIRQMMTDNEFGRRSVLKGATATAALLGAARAVVAGRRLRASRGSGDQQGDAGLHRADRCLAADRRQGKEALRQIRHHRRQRRQAGLVGHDARQHRAGLGRRRHRWRAYPDAAALPDLAWAP